MSRNSSNRTKGKNKAAKGSFKEAVTANSTAKRSFRTIKDSPAATKIDKAIIDRAVRKALGMEQ